MKKLILTLLLLVMGQNSFAVLFPLKCHKEETGERVYIEKPQYIRGHFTLLLEYTRMENGEELILHTGRKEVHNKIEQYTDENGVTKMKWYARSSADFRRETGEHPNVAGYYRFELFESDQNNSSTVESLNLTLDGKTSVQFKEGECVVPE